MTEPPAGRITGHPQTHDEGERPPIWVTTSTGRWPGRQHATAEGGRAILAAWSEDGLGHYRWIRATDITPRTDTPT